MKRTIKSMGYVGLCFGVALTFMTCGPSKMKRQEESLIHFRVAQDLFSKGETTQAMSELLKSAKLNPDDAEVQNMLGLAYAQRGLLPEAEKHLRNAVNLDATYSEAQNHLCALYIQLARYDDAIALCSKAIENVTYATPERAYHNIGLAYEKKGNVAKAIEFYRKGLLHNKNFVLSRKALGMISLQKNDYREAIKEYGEARKACEASAVGAWGDECPEVYYRMALVYVKLRERSKAVASFEQCVKLVQEGEYGEKCRANLKLLE